MLNNLLDEGRTLTDAALERLLPPATQIASIHPAMRHSVFAGGKRLRPILCMESAQWAKAARRMARRSRRRAGDAAHRLADPRRFPRARQQLPAPRPADLPQGLRRGHGHPRRRPLQTRAYEVLARLNARLRRAWPDRRGRHAPAPSAA